MVECEIHLSELMNEWVITIRNNKSLVNIILRYFKLMVYAIKFVCDIVKCHSNIPL